MENAKNLKGMFAKYKVGIKQILLTNATMFVSFFLLKLFRKKLQNS